MAVGWFCYAGTWTHNNTRSTGVQPHLRISLGDVLYSMYALFEHHPSVAFLRIASMILSRLKFHRHFPEPQAASLARSVFLAHGRHLPTSSRRKLLVHPHQVFHKDTGLGTADASGELHDGGEVSVRQGREQERW